MDLEGKRLAITGVGGFIGKRMGERARAGGMQVRGLEKSPEAARRAELAGIETIVGDVNDPHAVGRLCEGADVVFHTAAIVAEDGDMTAFERVNVGGTRTVCEAAAAAGARRFVHLSSVMVYGFDYPPDVAEEGPFRGEGNPYCETKLASDRVALGFHRSGAMEVIVIRPGDVYGPESVPWVARPAELIRRGFFLLPDGGRGIINHVYVDNLLDGVFLALEKDATGEAFNIADGVATTFKDYFDRLARIVGRRSVPTLPAPIMRAFVRAVGAGARLLGQTPPGSPVGVEFLRRPHRVSIAKARERLGYEPRVTLDEGMRRVEAWLKKEGKA